MESSQFSHGPAGRPVPARSGSPQLMDSGHADFIRRARAGDGPAWRWSRVESLLALGQRPDWLDDPATVTAWQFRSGTACSDVVPADVPQGTLAAVSAAHQLYVANGPRRWQVEAWLLAGLTVEQVAGRVGVPAAVAGAYAETFFDVVGRLHAGDWVWAYAVRVGLWGPTDPTEADVWRYVAASGGPAVLELVVGDYLSLPGPAHEDRHELATGIRTLVRFVATPMSSTKAFRRVMRQAWQVVSTRFGDRDPSEWAALAGYMDFLETAAGLDSCRPSARGQGRGRKRPGQGKAAVRPPEPQHRPRKVPTRPRKVVVSTDPHGSKGPFT